MKLSFTTLGCPDWTLRQIVENAARMGYDGVDLRGLLDQLDVSVCPEFTTGIEATRRLFADHGVAISGIATSACYAVVDPAEKQRQFDETRRNMELAARLGTHILRVYGGLVPEGYTVETISPLLVENLRQIGDEAAQFDVTLALETHDHWTDSTVFARLMAEVDHPQVRVLWDLHHPYRTNGEPPEVTYRNLAPYVVSTHVKDSVPGGPHSYPQTDWEYGHTYVPIGQGDVPLLKMLRMLIEGGYDGYAIFEWEKRWYPDVAEPEVVFPHYVKQMRAWLGAL